MIVIGCDRVVMSTAPAIDYDSQPRRNLRRRVTRVALYVALAAAGIWSLRVAAGMVWYADRDGLRRELEAVPGARVIRIDGYDDGPIMWKVVEATVAVAGAPEKTVTFRVGGPVELRAGNHLRIVRIGPYALWGQNPDGTWPDSVDVGRDGPFAGLLPVTIRNVDDLIAHYDQVMNAIGSLPADGTHRGRDGKDYIYHRK